MPKSLKKYRNKAKAKAWRNKMRRENYRRGRFNFGSKRRFWTDHEIAMLAKHEDMTDRELAQELGRSVQSVQIKRSRVKPAGDQFNFLSLCSGIEAASCAWLPLGWNCIGFSEIDRYANAVLAHHYPGVKNYGDMTKYKEWNLNARPDIIIAGTPCQSFSIAGLRKGLADPRGNLTLTYLAVIDRYRPKWMVWENVPGVLSDQSGAFGAFLGGLAELGYGFAYRILDAQYFGVAQRRRRVYVVGYLGDWRPAAAVLFERQSLSGYSPQSREKGERVAPELAQCLRSGSTSPSSQGKQNGTDRMTLVAAFEPGDNAMAVCYENHPNDSRIKEIGNMAPQLNARAGTGGNKSPLVAWALKARDHKGACNDPENGHLIPINGAVRRLTPIERERLQGFPDNYTNIPRGNKPESADGPRYKALGNSMAVPVIRWIGQRIMQVNEILK